MSILYTFDPCSWTATSTIFDRKNAFPPLLIQEENDNNDILPNNEQ